MVKERSVPRGRARVAALGTLAMALGLGFGVSGCPGKVIDPGDAGAGGNGGFDSLNRLTTGGVDKIDLLLMIDNSRSMADKQQILVATVPDLIRGLVNPPCLDAAGVAASPQPAGPLDPCPAGTKRRFPPRTDIHVGVVTSSLGGHGSDACPNTETFSCPGGASNPSNNDLGHLVSRADPCAAGQQLPTYQGQGFLDWDPAAQAQPPGEAVLGAIAFDPGTGVSTTVMPGLVPSLKDLVLGAGQIGCGYESSLESWYRFLVDPDPYKTLTVDPNTLRADPQGIDDVLLQQRKDFLRPSSLLAVIGLTDENDCSIKEYGQFWFAAQQRDPGNPGKNFYLPKARGECATNPNDPCCKSCGQDQGSCPADPSCGGSLDAKTDDVNLRCWDQKRRFGIDFLYPIDRYVTGLTSPQVPNRVGDMVPNPIFSDLDPTDGDSNVRDASLVFLAYITGVPWQDLANDPGDLKKGFKSPSDLAKADSNGHTAWDYILGDPGSFVPPLDPHMIEAAAPRSGSNPITGDALAPPSSQPGAGPDEINGHEYTPGTAGGVQAVADDLEYACVFTLPAPRDCSDPNVVACDCSDPKNDNPLCEAADPANPTTSRTKQVRAKAYPGLRQLALVKAMGSQGVVGSICPAQLDDPSSPSFGYRPAIQALLDRLTPALGGVCLPRQLPADAAGQVPCAVVEVRNSGQSLDAAACASLCAGLPGRIALPAAHAGLRAAALADPVIQASGDDCVCEIPQLGGAPGCTSVSSPLAACECDPSDAPVLGGQPVDGWCYVDATHSPPLGNPAVVAACPAGEQRLVRFVGAGNPAAGGTVLLACAGL
jgi:hypothetical protein